jgi:hypothetical protein
MGRQALEKLPAYPPGVQSAVDYAEAVIAGTVDAGRLVHLACERIRRDLDEDTWEFRPELAERAMDFAGQMPNIKGPEAGHRLRLMPWQQLVFANLFGFVEPGTSTRRFRQGVVFVPRGNGKRGILTDTIGLLDGAIVHPADVQDRDGAPPLPASVRSALPVAASRLR